MADKNAKSVQIKTREDAFAALEKLISAQADDQGEQNTAPTPELLRKRAEQETEDLRLGVRAGLFLLADFLKSVDRIGHALEEISISFDIDRG